MVQRPVLLPLVFVAASFVACASPMDGDVADGPEDVASTTSALTSFALEPGEGLLLPPPRLSPLRPLFVEAPPVLSPIAGAPVELVVGASSRFPLVFRVGARDVEATAAGYRVSGSITLDTPAGRLPLTRADLEFVWASDRSKGLERLSGTIDLPVPSLGALSGFTSTEPVRAAVGYELGADLTDLDAPLLPERRYLVFDFASGNASSAGPVSFSSPAGRSGTLVLDPSDPSFFVTGDFMGLDGVGPLSDLALGLSARGLLPFEPQETWGVEDVADPFTGHLYARGKVTLKKIPVSIDGEVVVNVDPTGKGRRFGSQMTDGIAIGANGTVSYAVDFLKFFTFEVPFAHATVGLRITDKEQHGYVSGRVEGRTGSPAFPFAPGAEREGRCVRRRGPEEVVPRRRDGDVLKANELLKLVPAIASCRSRTSRSPRRTSTPAPEGCRSRGGPPRRSSRSSSRTAR